MKVIKSKSGKRERAILTGMIVHNTVLSSIAAQWEKEGMFKSPWANIVGNWCTRFYQKYNKAPNRSIEHLYQNWADSNNDKDTAELVGKFLSDLSGEYSRRRKEINAGYLIDLAKEYFNEVKLQRLADTINGAIETGTAAEALEKVNKFSQVDIGEGSTIDLLTDESGLSEVFESLLEGPIIRYPGALGKFFGNALERDGFIGFMAPEKRGKTMALIDLAWRAMLQRRRVLFFEIGDMSKRQIVGRFVTRAVGRPLRPKTIKLATKLEYTEDGFDTGVVEKTYDLGISKPQAKEAFKKIMMEKVKSKESYFKLSVHANGTCGVSRIRSIVQQHASQNWVPDVIVVDYADLLAPPPGYSESRDQINANWKALRGLSQEYHCLVVTATQAKATSYNKESMDMTDYADDKRKFAHVTAMIGINQNATEKDQCMARLNWVVLREDEFSVERFVNVAGCMATASPFTYSAFEPNKRPKKSRKND